MGLSLANDSATLSIPLDSTKKAAVFEGLGALSAGASSRLLPDYPASRRAEILDLLFSPKTGAALQHFKVEIGGEVNSTCGTEPSHRRTREGAPDFTRGYEWWLMKEARKRNPAIPLECLAWGAPAWIGNGTYYSQDMADYVADFLEGARNVHGLDIGYTGIWNERAYDIAWIKLLRKTLDARGLKDVQIVAADAATNQWAIAKDMAADPELNDAVSVIGDHYPGFKTTDEAKARGKRLWAAEDGPWRGDWRGARQLARVYNRNYVVGGMTKTIIWSLVSSYYDNLPLPGSGLLRANTPWSGAYQIEPALWATAHTTQFTEPGWRYLAGEACRLLPGGSVVSLVSPDGGELSSIVETMDANEDLQLEFLVPAEFAGRTFHVWKTTERDHFQKVASLSPSQGKIALTVPPNAIVTLSTTTGQKSGVPTSPPAAPFPSPYADDFSSTPVGALGRFLSDQGGIFEVAEAEGGNKVLRQKVTRKGIEWQPTPEPETFLGEPSWEDQSIEVRARLEPVTSDGRPEAARYLAVYARVGYLGQNADPAPGYGFRIYESGAWEVRDKREVLAHGVVSPPGETWHTLALAAQGDRITASFDGKVLADLRDTARPWGQVGFGSGYHPAAFDDLKVTGTTPNDLARGSVATASSQWDESYGPEGAVDGIAADGLRGPTRWNSGKEPLAEEWIRLDFGRDVTCDTVRLVPFEDRAFAWRLEAGDGNAWKTVAKGDALGKGPATLSFAPVRTSKIRLVATSPAQSLSFYDFQVFDRRSAAGGATP